MDGGFPDGLDELCRWPRARLGGRPGWLSEGVHDVAVAFAPAEGGVVIVNAVGEGRLDRDEVLAAAPAAEDGRFRVPPVIGLDL